MSGTPHFHNAFNTTPSSAISAQSDHTYLMPTSPVRNRRGSNIDGYRPEIITTIGQRPACLVSASVTYVGNNEIYAFGGFDQYTDEVYNHVLRLNLENKQWSLVDNYGDIPGVRMGHTATLWQNGKVLIFGGENEHRTYLSDLIIFDIKTAHWHQPEIRGQPPRGRAKHAAVIHDDKLFIVGGVSGLDNNTVLDDFCYLDLKSFEWSRTWRFVPRFDHTCWVWGGRIWVFGGLTDETERANDIWWLDPKQSPCLDGSMPSANPMEFRRGSVPRPSRPQYPLYPPPAIYAGYAANSSSIQMNQASHTVTRKAPMAPGSISSLNFISGPNIPTQSVGRHFHVFSSGCLLDFTTLAVTSSHETSLCALELETMRWEKLADGRDLYNPNYRWHYCILNHEGTHAWLLGSPYPPNSAQGEYLSDVMSIDLKKLGMLGNSLASEFRFDQQQKVPTSDTNLSSSLSGIGADLARMFDKSPENGGATDFIVTADPDEYEEVDEDEQSSKALLVQQPARPSRPIYVHRLILESRWPHFARMIASQMAEFHSKKLHIPEPFSVVRAFLYYLYTDSISPNERGGPSLDDVAGMLVMSNLYDMPRLRLLCRNRLGRELDVEHAATIWERAGAANEDWLKRRAARYCLTYWGRVVRTAGFRKLKHTSLMDLCQEPDIEGRVLGAEELETVGGLGGARFGALNTVRDARPRRFASATLGEEVDELDDDEGMEMS